MLSQEIRVPGKRRPFSALFVVAAARTEVKPSDVWATLKYRTFSSIVNGIVGTVFGVTRDSVLVKGVDFKVGVGETAIDTLRLGSGVTFVCSFAIGFSFIR